MSKMAMEPAAANPAAPPTFPGATGLRAVVPAVGAAVAPAVAAAAWPDATPLAGPAVGPAAFVTPASVVNPASFVARGVAPLAAPAVTPAVAPAVSPAVAPAVTPGVAPGVAPAVAPAVAPGRAAAAGAAPHPQAADGPRMGAAADSELAAFLAGHEPARAVLLRTLAHAWVAGGGGLQCGKHTVRLIGRDGDGRPFTGATLHAEPPRIEFARVLLTARGVTPVAWTAWSDERPELVAYGFAPDAKFPVVDVGNLPDAALARLATGLRDLAAAVLPPAVRSP